VSGTNVTTAAVQSQPKQKRHLVRTLGKSLREYRKPSILTPIFVVVEGVLEILIPTVMASLIDEGITGKSMPAIVKFGLILLACSLCSLAAGFLAGKFAAIAGAGFAKNLRHDEFEKVQGFSFTNIDKFSTGSIITRLTTDVTNLQNAYSMIIRLGVRAPIMMIVAWIFSFRISPSISLVFLACIPSVCAAWRCTCTRCSSACSTPTTSSTTWSTRTFKASAWSSPTPANRMRSASSAASPSASTRTSARPTV